MSAKKKPETGGIKSFFISKPAAVAQSTEPPDPPTPAPVAAAPISSRPQRQSTKGAVYVDLIDSDEKAVATVPAIKKNAFFMSKIEKQEMIAQQRESRIQEEIARSRKETNQLLMKDNHGSTEHACEAGQGANSFFLARPTASNKDGSQSKRQSLPDADNDPSTPLEASFPDIQNVGLGGSLGDIVQYNQQMKGGHLACSRNARTQVEVPCDDLRAYLAIDKHGAQRRQEADLSVLEFACAFPKSSSTGGRQLVCTRAAVCRSDMYPLAQAAMNLRALWLQWAQQEVSFWQRQDQCQSLKQGQALKAQEVKAGDDTAGSEEPTAGQKQLSKWLRMWSARRKATGSTASSANGRKNSRGGGGGAASRIRRSSSQASTKKIARVKSSRRGRVVSDEDSDSDDYEFDEADGEGEDSQDEEDDEEGCWDSEVELVDSASDSEALSRSARNNGRRRDSGSRKSMVAIGALGQAEQAGGGCDDDGTETLTNVLVLQGPSGCGKSAAVHESARALGFKVIEVNTSQARNGAAIKKLIAEAAQSAHIMDNLGGAAAGGSGLNLSTTTATDMNLILFDEVDIVFEDDGDAQLYNAIQQLAHSTKCPIVLTTEQPLPFFRALHARHVTFRKPVSSKAALGVLTRSVASSLSVGTSADTICGSGKDAFLSLFSKPPVKDPAATLHKNATAGAHTPRLTSAEMQMLEVLWKVSGGDLRACLATLQCLPGAFPRIDPNRTNHKPASALIDLTGSPFKPETKDSAQTGADPVLSSSFVEFLACKGLDFAVFDTIPLKLSAAVRFAPLLSKNNHAPEVNDGMVSCVPIVHEVHPRSGLCSSGFVVNIRGSHFLQSATIGIGDDEENNPASVRVLLDGAVDCPCVLKSDSLIVAYIPPVDTDGVHVLVVELSVQVRSPTGARKVCLNLRSDIAGAAGGWIQLRHRTFPSVRVRSADGSKGYRIATATSSKASDGPGGVSSSQDTDMDSESMEAATRKELSAVEVAHAANHCSPTTFPVVTEPHITATKSRGKRLLGGHHKTGGDKAADEDALFGATADSFGVADALPNKRRSRRIMDDEDASEPVPASPTIVHLAEVGRLESSTALCRTASDQLTVSTVVAPENDDAGTDTLVAVNEHFINGFTAKLLEVMQTCLDALAASSFSEPFQQPVSEAAVPGYRSVIERPMDLGTVADSLQEGLYVVRNPLFDANTRAGGRTSYDLPDLVAMVADVRQVWRNCVKFNDVASPYVRSAYLLSFHFEDTLIKCLQEAFVSCPFFSCVSVETSASDGRLYIGVNDTNVFTLEACDAFESCAKLRKSLSESRMQALIQDSKGNVDEEGAACFSSADEALRNEIRLDGVSVHEKLSEAATLRSVRLSAKTTATESAWIVNGLHSQRPKQQLPSDVGQEYEDDEGTPLVYLKSPNPLNRQAWTAAQEREMNSIELLTQVNSRLCDADLLTCAAVNAENYLSAEIDDIPLDSSFRDFTAHCTSSTLSPLSSAQWGAAARGFACCAATLRMGALEVLTTQTTHFASSNTQSPGRDGSWLQSRFLTFQDERAAHTQLYQEVVATYVSYPGNRSGNSCGGLLNYETMSSLNFVPRSFAVDVFPQVAAMCRTEQDNDEELIALLNSEESDLAYGDLEEQPARSLLDSRRRTMRCVSGSNSSALSQSSRRSSRRGQSVEKRRHNRFSYMKQALGSDVSVLNKLGSSACVFSM